MSRSKQPSKLPPSSQSKKAPSQPPISLLSHQEAAPTDAIGTFYVALLLPPLLTVDCDLLPDSVPEVPLA